METPRGLPSARTAGTSAVPSPIKILLHNIGIILGALTRRSDADIKSGRKDIHYQIQDRAVSASVFV